MIPLNKLKCVEDIDVKEKAVLMRVDFNVPMDSKGEITDDTRIRKCIPTIKNIIERGGRLTLISHLGRPKGKRNEKFSLLAAADQLSLILKKKVTFIDDCVGDGVKKLVKELMEGEVILLENTRFYAEEEKNDEKFAQRLAEPFDIYVTDAFGSLHRAHASTSAITRNFKIKGIGLLVKAELEYLNPLLSEPKRPFTIILGGAKVSDKIPMLENLIKKANRIIIGGGMAYTFLKAKGIKIGKSLFDESKLSRAQRIMTEANERGCRIVLPVDHVVASELKEGVKTQTVEDNIPDDMMGLDIGPKTRSKFIELINDSKTVFWNGPLGAFETKPFSEGTFEIAKAVGDLKGQTIVGGGDSVSAITQVGADRKVSHVSTGGGATLEFLEGKVLPGLEALL